MEYNVNTIKLNLQIKYLNNLIAAANKNNINCDLIKKELIILSEQEYINHTCTENLEDTSNDTNKISITETENDYLFLKPWTKLTLIHKVIKVKEFVNNLNIQDPNEKEILKNELIEVIKDKKIKNKIIYDDTKGKLLSISQLSYENNKYFVKQH